MAGYMNFDFGISNANDLLEFCKRFHLQCPVCYEIPSAYWQQQCREGHLICRDCGKKIPGKKCPICREAMSRSRNLVAESLLNALPKACKYGLDGCHVVCRTKEDLQNHQNLCQFRPVKTCPGDLFCQEYQTKTAGPIGDSNLLKHISYHVRVRHADQIDWWQNKATHKDATFPYTGVEVSAKVTFDLSDHDKADMTEAAWRPQSLELDGKTFYLHCLRSRKTSPGSGAFKHQWHLITIISGTRSEALMYKSCLKIISSKGNTSKEYIDDIASVEESLGEIKADFGWTLSTKTIGNLQNNKGILKVRWRLKRKVPKIRRNPGTSDPPANKKIRFDGDALTESESEADE